MSRQKKNYTLKKTFYIFSFLTKAKLLLAFFMLSAILNAQQMNIANIGRAILESQSYEDRYASHLAFKDSLKQLISTERGFSEEIENLSNSLRIAPEDESFCIYTWAVPDKDYNYSFHGLLAVKNKEEILIYDLLAEEYPPSNVEYKKLKPNKWYPTLYYGIKSVKFEGKTHHTLLGYSPSNTVQQKVIEVLYFDNAKRPLFGAPIFYFDEIEDMVYKRKPKRIILKYSPDISASVRWNEDDKMIVMDHLVPRDPKLKGVYQYYGIDFSYDGLKWSKEGWRLVEDIRFNSRLEAPIAPPKERGLSTQDTLK